MRLRASDTNQLVPFVLRLKDGYLIGMAAEPSAGSPCSHCIELWLTRRRIWCERMNPDGLLLRRELLDELKTLNSPHVFYELSNEGAATKLECMVFPHPMCSCRRDKFIAPLEVSGKANFAFSPMHQIKCARYTTPSGNLWLTHIAGTPEHSQNPIKVYSAGRDRSESRMRAVDEWIKRAAFGELSQAVLRNESLSLSDFKTGKVTGSRDVSHFSLMYEGMGVGATEHEATIDGLHALAKARTLRKYAGAMKHPMLVVGTNNWVRNKVPFFLLQQYDLHLLFYPNSTPSWVVGVVGMSRVRTDESPVFVFASHSNVSDALDLALMKMMDRCRPADWHEEPLHHSPDKTPDKLAKLGQWWTHWIYRCPKISLKDVLHLEPYTHTVEQWREYFADGQEPLFRIPVNLPQFPSSLRTLTKLHTPSMGQSLRNVNGIGTWSAFRDAAN